MLCYTFRDGVFKLIAINEIESVVALNIVEYLLETQEEHSFADGFIEVTEAVEFDGLGGMGDGEVVGVRC